MTSQNDSWHAMPIDQVLTQTRSSLIGLDPSEAKERLQLYGANTLPEGRRTPWIIRFLAQFQSPLIYILLVASAISYALRETIDGSVILLITFFNAVIGFVQEHKAERALEALKKMSAPTAKVMRSSEVTEIPSDQLVVGDTVVLEAGDSVPADVRLLEATRLKVDESALTGETVSVEKSSEPIPYNTPLTDRRNMLYMGTPIVSGRGLGVVVATGDNTQIGQIAKEVQTTPTEETPLQQKLTQIGQLLGMAGVTIALFLVVIGLWRQFLLKDLFFTAVAAAVSFIPEGLPAVVTIVLAVGVQRMAHRNAIVRKLPAVETLGSATVICTDKTGTITKNEMTARICWTLSAQFYITGDGYRPEGQFRLNNTAINPDDFPDLKLALIIATLCNDSYVTKQNGGWRVTGDPTEGGLIVAAAKAGLKKTILEEQYKRIDELPFESQARYMATLNMLASGHSLLCVKGAPERILEMCTHIRNHGQNEPLSSGTLSQVLGVYHSMAAEAYRILAVAYKELPGTKKEITHADAEEGLVFVGLIAMLDPPRPEVFDAVRRAKLAGIRIIMITGDNAITAEAIARDVGILDGEEIVSGEELGTMSNSELAQRIHRIAVFARTEPGQKYRIVEALRHNGELVAMTGDGANDAPALKLADIGIA
ncbi:MAG: cation-translocating P-type ATPase, partial [Armatimonadota bacterium]